MVETVEGASFSQLQDLDCSNSSAGLREPPVGETGLSGPRDSGVLVESNQFLQKDTLLCSLRETAEGNLMLSLPLLRGFFPVEEIIIVSPSSS